jgi:chemotaxis protein CheX
MTPIPEKAAQEGLIIAATGEVMSTMLGTDAVVLERHEPRPLTLQEGVFATVGMAGPCIGSGTFACSAASACKLAGQFLMADYDQVNTEVLDAIGELANMVVGNIKTALEAEMGQVGLSIPTVVFGKNFLTRCLHSNSGVAVAFRVGEELLTVGLALSPKPAHVEPLAPGFVTPHYIPG